MTINGAIIIICRSSRPRIDTNPTHRLLSLEKKTAAGNDIWIIGSGGAKNINGMFQQGAYVYNSV